MGNEREVDDTLTASRGRAQYTEQFGLISHVRRDKELGLAVGQDQLLKSYSASLVSRANSDSTAQSPRVTNHNPPSAWAESTDAHSNARMSKRSSFTPKSRRYASCCLVRTRTSGARCSRRIDPTPPRRRRIARGEEFRAQRGRGPSPSLQQGAGHQPHDVDAHCGIVDQVPSRSGSA